MKIIFSNAIINIDNVTAVYSRGGYLCLETTNGVFYCSDSANNALQRIAVALAEGNTFLELDDDKLIIEEEEDNDDIGSDIE